MNRSLLIVENDPDQLEVLARWSIRAGYQVVSVYDPHQALQAAKLRQFQVALVDACFPKMDGIELMQRLKWMQDAVQVVMLSDNKGAGRRAMAEGACACLVKPYQPALLETTVEDAFERAVGELQRRRPLAVDG